MKKIALCLAALLLSSCGDDLGWDQNKDDGDAICYDSATQDSSQTPADVNDDDSADLSGDVTAVDSSSDIIDSDDDANDVEMEEDVTETSDSSSDTEEEVVAPPECVTQTDCVDSNPCTDDGCETGKCVNTANNGNCTDDDECTGGDTCQLDECIPGIAINCDDLNPCTDDSCDKAVGCVHLPNVATCTDGNACTLDDACSNAECTGVPAICDDGEVCTDDSCDPPVGCVNLANASTCTDGDACTVTDVCDQGMCKPGALKICFANQCVSASCVDGTCVNDINLLNDVICNDGSSCTSEARCLDGNCLPVVDVDCNDANSCTADSCSPVSGCANQGLVDTLCEDGNACTKDDTCQNSSCAAGPTTPCDDENFCTLDSCDPTSGCIHDPVADGASCVVGICSAGECTCPSGFGCAAPKFSYVNDTNAGMIGGMGGGVGPKMGCANTDVLIGLGFDYSPGTKTATRTTAICGKVAVAPDGTVSTQQTSTQKSGGSGCYGWDPSVATPLTVCPSGWAVVGLKALKPGGTLFNSVTIVCGELGTSGKWSGEKQNLVVPGMPGTGTTQEIVCPPESIARYFETRAGCGQDALTMYCAVPAPDCTGQNLICKDVL